MNNLVVKATVLDVVRKHGSYGSDEMRAISAGTICDLLLDEHGIVVKIKTIINVMRNLQPA